MKPRQTLLNPDDILVKPLLRYMTGNIEKFMVVSHRVEDLVKEDVILMKVGDLEIGIQEVHCDRHMCILA